MNPRRFLSHLGHATRKCVPVLYPAALLLMSHPPALEAQNLVTNGDFSANAALFINNNGYFGGSNPASVPNWTTTGSGVNGTLTPSGDPFAPATNVPSFLFMQSPRTASQAIATVAATDYLFSFDASARNGNTAGVSVFANNLNPASLSLEAGYGWLPGNAFQRYAFGFTATGPQTIQFNSSGVGDHTTNITNVSVTASAGSVWQITDGTRFFTETSGTNNYGFSLVGNNQQIYHRPGTATYTGNITTDGSAGALTFVGREDEGVSNLIFSGSTMTLGAKTFAVTGTTVDSEAQSANSKVTLTNSTVTTTSNVDVGRGTLEITGTTSLTIGGQLRSGAGGDWGRFIMGPGTSVTATGGVNMRANGVVASGLYLNGGTLTTSSITGNAYGGQTNVQFNGTTVVASGNNADFLDVRLNGNATPYSAAAQLGNNGGIFNTNGFAITINNSLANMSGNNGSLIKQGAGTLTVNGSNTFTGLTQFEGGIMNVATVSNYGVASSIGARTLAQETASGNGIGLWFRGGTLQYTGSTAQSTDRFIRVSTAGGTIDASGSNPGATLSFTNGADPINLFENPGTRTITLTGTNTGANTFGLKLINQGGSATSLTKTGAGTWVVSGNNTFTGLTQFAGGVFNASTLSNYGVSSSIGARTLAQETAVGDGIGLWFRGGTLQYTGSTAQSTDRFIRVSTAGGTIDASGSNPGATLSFTNGADPINLFETSGTRTITLTGTNTGANNFGLKLINQGGSATSLLKTGIGTWVVSAANTYSGTTTVSGGTLTLSGARTGNSGQISVSNLAGQDATLNIQDGIIAMGGNNFFVASAPTTAATGTVNQSGGAVSFTGGNALLLGNGGVANTGIYNLSGGSITTYASASRGIMLGVNTGSAGGIFNLSGTGVLNMTAASGAPGDGVLQVGRFDSAANNTTNEFNQTGGTANVGILSIGGNGATGSGITSTVNLTGGTFSANQFPRLALGNSNTAVMTIGGTADVTLPAFPTARGTGSTATLNLNGGTLRPLAASTAYMGGLTNAFIMAGGATIDVPTGRDITISQSLLTHGVSTGGGLTKTSDGVLTLTGSSTYTGATTINGGTVKLQAGGSPLLTDNFSATGNPNTFDLNFNLANRQTGSAALQNWTPAGNTQVGNVTVVQQPPGTNGDYLLLAFGASASLSGMPMSTANAPGPLKINFDMFKGTTGNATEWTSFTMRGAPGNGFPITGSGEFGFLYRQNTGVQVFNNGAAIETIGSTVGGDSFGFYLADSAGTGSPFAGNGTRLVITQGGSVLGSYALNTGMATSYLAFGAAGSMIGGVDNLAVNAFQNNVLDPSTAVSLTTAGATLQLDGVTQTVASLSGVVGSSVNLGPFSRLTVNGPASTTFNGVISGTMGSLAKAGSGSLNLTGANTYTGGTTISGGTLFVNNTTGSGTGSGAVVVQSGGTLGGTGTITTTGLTVQSGGTLAPGNSPGNLTVNGPVALLPGAIFGVEVTVGGSTAVGNGTIGTDLLTVNGTIDVTGALLSGTYGGGLNNLYTGNLSADNMTWLINNDLVDSITGTFANTAPSPGLSGLFGTPAYFGSVGGQPFAVFYNSQFGVTNATGLSGGNDLLLIAIPEPSRALFLLAACAGWFLRRRRA